MPTLKTSKLTPKQKRDAQSPKESSKVRSVARKGASNRSRDTIIEKAGGTKRPGNPTRGTLATRKASSPRKVTGALGSVTSSRSAPRKPASKRAAPSRAARARR